MDGKQRGKKDGKKDGKKALVISGGGSKGAWAVGVLRYLMKEEEPSQKYDIVVGTSRERLYQCS
jgi:predicted acylesterase/phospholipase RssA